MNAEQVLTAADVGSANRARLIRLLYRDGPQSRAALSTRMGVSRATVTTIAQPLLDSGMLVEHSARRDACPDGARRRSGKPARPLWFGDVHLIGAVYVSGDGVRTAILRMDGMVVREARADLDPNDGAIGERLIEHCAEFFAGTALLGIGVAAAGMVDTDHGVILEVFRQPHLSDLDLADRLREELGAEVVVDHHPRVQAIGDLWFGEGKELSNFAALHTGEVLGIGFVHDDLVLRGHQGAGGEIGHIVIDINGERCVCGRNGCWETLATLPWLRRRAAAEGLEAPDRITCAELVRRSADDPCAARLLDEYVGNIAQGMADVEQILGVHRYLIHGDLGAGGRATEQRLGAALARLLPGQRPLPEITMVADDDRSTLLGAAGLVLSTRFPPAAGPRPLPRSPS
ncbi:sugar kinase [Brachybacterium endophyticum]|uniref:Sugar kinase n=1 Tax=Brachybacterium endophyticum TaxID=2182385 RepID=A0A2U2RND1_9MICO|nr:ROK family transcriptional regulator [Brachybacterium endophyticum]PWH07387.1 sugar kinase [Brachybacterium endophyticum]